MGDPEPFLTDPVTDMGDPEPFLTDPVTDMGDPKPPFTELETDRAFPREGDVSLLDILHYMYIFFMS
jgi:hypothetical protein|tara:strand:- start:6891 stop:7091 length:201 start_codon:yes stop_codon:yes gene_type:complete